MSGDIAVSVHGVKKSFVTAHHVHPVLHGIDIDVAAGDLTYLVGASGSGKTTLVSIMAGILTPSEGTVKLFGTDIFAMDHRHLVDYRLSHIGFIFQQYNLIPTIDAAANAAVPLIARGVNRHDALAAGNRMLERLAIGDQAAKYPHQLSGGQQQRVAIARALVHDPRLVICDEPTAALDARSGRRVMDLLHELAVGEDRACVIVTHDNRIFDFADRILVMEDGLITHDGKEVPVEEDMDGTA
ncbi:ABC transporter ATP-binding protein [Sphingomicrobium nitratireducens]|uniref:ABC transporter ATP-binding protein n=1 Tax=Sphingomicrobium nitratireducens TaxID=2964666 RepID=UPI00223EC545|nr:ABC transporter ATP-binding protein [Sphingomicrobium nitratireducens]